MNLDRCERRAHIRLYKKEYRERTTLVNVNWIQDEEKDCMNGMDEHWEETRKCSVLFEDGEERVRVFESGCKEVYKCSDKMKNQDSYIEIDEMCKAKSKTCERQNNVCTAAKNVPNIETKPIEKHRISKIGGQNGNNKVIKYIAPCLPGLLKYSQFNCTAENRFILGFSDKRAIYGIPSTTWVYENNKKFDCKYFFGEYFLFLSCNNLCQDHDDNGIYWREGGIKKCPFQHPNAPIRDFSSKYQGDRSVERRITIRVTKNNKKGRNMKLVAVSKLVDSYQLRWFGCENGNIIDLENVCDLENNCGDNSDEKNCANSINCPTIEVDSYTYRLPFSSIGDGKIDCRSRTTSYVNETNEECFCGGTKMLIERTSPTFKVAVIFGTLATVINFFVMLKNVRKLIKTPSSSVLLGDTIYMLMISIGDFCVGVYLLLLVYHSNLHKYNFCTKQVIPYLLCCNIYFLSQDPTLNCHLQQSSQTIKSRPVSSTSN